MSNVGVATNQIASILNSFVNKVPPRYPVDNVIDLFSEWPANLIIFSKPALVNTPTTTNVIRCAVPIACVLFDMSATIYKKSKSIVGVNKNVPVVTKCVT